MIEVAKLKPVVWVGSSKADFVEFPDEVKRCIGYALYVAQQGGKHADAKPLTGFGGAGIMEVVADHRGDTFRTVYTVRLAGRVYVLHAFQKKSKSGIKTPKTQIDLLRARLKRAELEHADSLQRGKLEGNR
jgi:phage-related protein